MIVSGASKTYRTYANLFARLLSWLTISVKPRTEQRVLHDASLEIYAGESVAIVGENGAGKSTLLKLIAGTARPTHGQVTVSGDVVAILELGTGFNPELTGRVNAHHLLGLMNVSAESQPEYLKVVEEFAEIGAYFDQPVRTYSSGMQMRVAFAVATCRHTQVLIVDEALAVGDAYFQLKCADRIRSMQEHGTSLILVSHDMAAIKLLCRRSILLENGVIIQDGKSEEVLDYYNALIGGGNDQTDIKTQAAAENRVETSSGSGEARVIELSLRDSTGQPAEFVNVGETVHLQAKIEVFTNLERLVFGYSVRDRLGQVAYGTNTWHTNQVIESPKCGDVYDVSVVFNVDYGAGSYSVQTALTDRETHLTANYEWHDLALVFTVVNKNRQFFVGYLWQQPEIVVAKVNL